MSTNLFNLDMIKNNNLDTENILTDSFIEESYFLTTLNFISKTTKEVNEHTRTLYRNLLETTDSEVINESFENFIEKVKEIIAKFIKYIKSLVDRFIVYLNKFIRSDKYIKKNKELFKEFDDSSEFTINGYYYTFDPHIPVIEPLRDYNKDFIELDFDVMNNDNKDNNSYKEYISKQHGKLTKELDNNFYDKFRAEVLGIENSELTQAEFIDELFETFRDGHSKKEEITINKENLLNSLSFFLNYPQLEKEIKKTQTKIEKEYKRIEKSIQGLVNKSDHIDKTIKIAIDPDYDGSTGTSLDVSPEVYNKLNLFIKAKVNQVIEMSNIHSMAFSYKLDAVKECFKQDKQILYRGLSEIHKQKRNIL